MPDTRQPTPPGPGAGDDTDMQGAELEASRERHEGLQRRAQIADRRARIARSGLFDADWYRRHHAPAMQSDLDPLDHYLSCGIAAGAAPGPLFDPQAYLRRVWHLLPGRDDPLGHYLQHGLAEGRPSVSRVDAPAGGLRDGPVEALVSQQPPSHRLTLAVAVHVFYVDLFGEICDALAMIPYRFTLLVTTDDTDKADAIRAGFAARSLDALLLVRVGPNRGRNFGPFLLHWRQIVLEHELVLHLHTKKSLYTGSERTGWRHGLLRTLLPAAPVVSGLIARFVSDPTLGVVTAAPGEAVRYWGYNWLSNRHLAQPLFDRLGLRSRVPSGMFDYPVGGMFWARTDAIAALLEHDWQAADFPEERGQTDGTIMHAIERIILLMAAEAGYGFVELDYEHGLCRPGWSSRNLDQYRLASHAGLLDTIDRVDTVSFDLFDTLLTRICLAPDAVHRFIGWAAARRYPGAVDFPARRRAAEASLRRERNGGGPGSPQHPDIAAVLRRRPCDASGTAAMSISTRSRPASPPTPAPDGVRRRSPSSASRRWRSTCARCGRARSWLRRSTSPVVGAVASSSPATAISPAAPLTRRSTGSACARASTRPTCRPSAVPARMTARCGA